MRQSEADIDAMDKGRDQALNQVSNRAQKALSEAKMKREVFEKKLTDLASFEGGAGPRLDEQNGIDTQNPEDLKLLAILKHFGGKEILKVVRETNELQEQYEDLKSKIKDRESELKRMKQQAQEAKKSVEHDIVPLEKLLSRLVEKEDELRAQIVSENKQDALHNFLSEQQGLLEQERDLKRLVAKKEEELAQIRSDLCQVTGLDEMTPDQRERAELYIEWKQNLRKKHETLRSFRETQYRMLMAIKARRDTQYVVAELEKKAELEEGQRKAAEYKSQIEKTEDRIKLLEQGIVKAGAAMRQFRREFEQMRVAIMLDKTIKATQMQSLANHKKRLQRAETLFQQLIETEKKRIEEEEAEKWRPRLEAAKQHMEQQLQEQEEKAKQKMAKVAEALSKRYKEGFAPLLQEAEAKYNEEVRASEKLRAEIKHKEKCLQDAEDELRRLESEVLEPKSSKSSDPQKAAEMEKLNMELRALWVELKSDPDEVATFLSELDALAPYSDAVLRLYEEEDKAIRNQTS